MKRRNILLGAVGAIAAAAVFVASPWETTNEGASYTKKGLSDLESMDANDYRLWLEARYIDAETGERITDKKMRAIEAAIEKLPKNRALSFIELGPDNIGGRTRSVQVDTQNNNVIWAGSVSGGLWKSENAGNFWEKVETYEAAGAAPYISSIAQFADGTLFIATGSLQEGWSGDGVWYTQDQGATWQQVPGTSSASIITEIFAANSGNTLWLATNSGIGGGLKRWTFGDANLTASGSGMTGTCTALAGSPDGSILVAADAQKNTWVSSDAGSTWTNKAGAASSNLVPGNAPRIEYAVSQVPNSNGQYSIYAVRTNSNLLGMHVSKDNGATWSQFIGSASTPGNLDIYRNQGGYNSIVSVTPQNNEKILIGGIDIWKWEETVSTPVSGGFEKLTQWFLNPSSSKYAHADNHEMEWDGTKLYIGNDGGIGITYDPELNWYPANRGYGVTQFYGISYDKHGAVIGGTQDNGSLYNDHSLSSWKEFREVSGGDGFQAEISFFNPNVLFSTSQFGVVLRSGDKGAVMSNFTPPYPSTYGVVGEGGSFPFHTSIAMAEYYDPNSEDTIIFVPIENYNAGDVVMIPSLATGDTIEYVTPTPIYYDDTLFYDPATTTVETAIRDGITGTIINLDLYNWVHHGTSGSGSNPPVLMDSLLVDLPSGTDTVVVDSVGTFTHYYGVNSATGDVYDMVTDSVVFGISWDTVVVTDPFQSWFVAYNTANGGELWGTRNANRLAAADQQWGIIAQGIGSTQSFVDVEFSRDLEHCYVSLGNRVVRIDGLGSVYSSDPNFSEKVFYGSNPPTATSASQIYTGTSEGLATNPNDDDDLLIFAGTGGIRRSANATAATPTFATINGIASPSPAVYDGIVDRDDPNTLVIGTSHGVFCTENGGSTWTDASLGFSGTPVFEVKQSWRTWDEGNFRPGEIYIGTFGRGIWSSASYLSVDDNGSSSNNGSKDEAFNLNLSSYPNPTTANTTLTFELPSASDVYVNVYSFTGKLVKSIKKSNMNSGSQSINIEAADLPKGSYIVRFQAGNQKATSKFIKM